MGTFCKASAAAAAASNVGPGAGEEAPGVVCASILFWMNTEAVALKCVLECRSMCKSLALKPF